MSAPTDKDIAKALAEAWVAGARSGMTAMAEDEFPAQQMSDEVTAYLVGALSRLGITITMEPTP